MAKRAKKKKKRISPVRGWRWLFVIPSLFLFFSALLFAFPEWAFSNAGLKTIQQFLAVQGVPLELDLNSRAIEWQSWGRLRVKLDFQKICVRPENTSVCLENGKGTVLMKVGLHPFFAIEELGPLEVAKLSVLVEGDSKKPSASKEEGAPVIALPDWLRPHRLNVKIAKGEVAIREDRKPYLNADFKVECKAVRNGGPREANCALPVRIDFAGKEAPLKSIDAKVVVESTDRVLQFKATSQARGTKLDKIDLSIEGSKKLEAPVEFTGKVAGTFNQAPWGITMDGAVSHSGEELKVQTEGFLSPTAFGKKTSKHFQKAITLENCGLSASFKKLSEISLKGCVLDVPLATRFRGRPRVAIDGNITFPQVRGSLQLSLPQQEGRAYSASGFLSASFEKLSTGMHLNVDPDSKVNIHFTRFQDVVKMLRGTPYAVPAPVNEMSGELDFSVRAAPEGSAKLGIPFNLETNLKSKAQQLKLTAAGKLSMSWAKTFASHLDADVAIQDGRFELPPLKLTSIPEILPDPRIGAQAKLSRKKPAPAPFTYNITIETEEDAHLFIASNLLVKPLPLKLDLKISDQQPILGTVQITPVPVTLFRRSAQVKELRLRWVKSNANESLVEVRGNFAINFPDYAVTVLLAGTLDRPRVTFDSSPPLTRQEIIALLLFGNEELGSEQNASVAGFDSAVTQRSIGLASLYFLASTPIQSISYDPTTKAVTAKVRLGDKTTVNLTGGPEGSEKVGFSRRIGKNWAVTTEVPLGDTSSGQQGVSGFLEWFKRY